MKTIGPPIEPAIELLPPLLLVCAAGTASLPGSACAQVTLQLGAGENDWYQGHQGQWVRQGNNYRWESTHGDDWYQGRQGNWYQEQNGWQYQDNDGNQYRQGWQWYDRYGKYHQSFQHGPHNQR